MEDKLNAEEAVMLSLAKEMVRGGGSEGDVLAMFARAAGEKLVELPEAGGGTIHIKPNRVARLEAISGGRTRVYFTPGGDDRPVVLAMDLDSAERRLR